MNYDQRMAQISKRLSRFMSRYTAPRAMVQEAKEATFLGICEAINKRLPSQIGATDIDHRLDVIFDKVADTHDTNAWPLQAQFVKASNAAGQRMASDTAEAFEVDPMRHAAARITSGEPVGDGWLWGRNCHDLLRQGLVTKDQISAYRSGLFLAERKLLGEDEALRLERARNARHEAAA